MSNFFCAENFRCYFFIFNRKTYFCIKNTRKVALRIDNNGKEKACKDLV